MSNIFFYVYVFVRRFILKVIDYKGVKRSKTKKRFKNLDKALLKCSSFEEQRKVLVQHYNDSPVTRDELLVRKYSLENNISFGLKEIILDYKNVMVVFVSTILGSFLGCFYELDKIEKGFWWAIKNFTFPVILLIVGCGLLAWFDKEKYVRDNIPMEEIHVFELNKIKQALASDPDVFELTVDL